MMKKTFLFVLVISMLFSLVSCKSAEVEEEPVVVEPVVEEPVVEEPVVEEPVEQPTPVDVDIKGLAGAAIPGVLYQLQEGEPVIRGISLTGNRATMELAEPSTENIRFIFELNEWIGIYVDTDQVEGLSARLVKHEEDSSVYTAAYFDEAVVYAYCDIFKPEQDRDVWGEINVSEDESTGFYDLVFVNNEDNMPLAYIILDFFKMTELERYSESQLSQIMADIIAAGVK